MLSLTDAYEKGTSTTFMTIAMGVATSLLFTTGLVLILNSHNNTQTRQIQQTLTAFKKSLAESGNSSSAALLSLEEALAAENKANDNNNKAPAPINIPPINLLDTLTVKGATNLQGSVKTSKDVSVGGKLNVGDTTSLNDLSATGAANFGDNVTVAGDVQISGSAQLDGDISAASLDLANGLTSGGDLAVSGSANIDGDLTLGGAVSADSLSLSANADVGGDLTVGGSAQFGGDLTTSGDTSTATLTTSSDATIGGALNVNGNTTITGSLDVSGTLTQGGNDLNGLFIQNGPATPQDASINITGDISAATLTTSGDITIGTIATPANLAVTGDINTAGITASGAGSIGGDLTVTGGITGSGDLSVTGDVGGATLTISGDGSIGGTLDVTGTATLGSADIGGDGTVGGNLDVTGTVSAATLSASTSIKINGTDIINANGLVLTGTGNSQGSAVTNVVANNHKGETLDCSGGGTGSTGQHIRILRIDAGIVTGIDGTCADNTNGSGFNYDLAENYPSTQTLSAGDVVSIDPANVDSVIKSTVSDDAMAIGIVSTAPGYTLGSDGPGYPIALSGRVPVKVTDEGGPIAPGDYLTTSSTPGYAKKAVFGDKTIGQALAGFSGSSGTVDVFVNISGGNSTPQNSIQSTQTPGQISDTSFNNLNVSGTSTLGALKVNGLASIQDLQVTGQATVATLTVNGHVIGNNDTRGTVTIPAGSTSAHRDFAKAYDTVPVLVASPEGQPASFSTTPSTTGFDIRLSTPATTDIKFDYLVQQ